MCFYCSGAFMLIKCYISKGKIIRVQLSWPNEDPIREMTIDHPPNVRKRTREPLIYLRTSTPVARCFKEFFFIFYFSLFSVCKPFTSIVFTKPQIQIEIHLFEPTTNHLHEENSSLYSILKPLYYSSYATAVGGI